MHPPSFREHRAERQREPGHQQPRARRAYVREHVHAGHPAVEAQEQDAGVRQNGANDYQVVQVRARHFYVPETFRTGTAYECYENCCGNNNYTCVDSSCSNSADCYRTWSCTFSNFRVGLVLRTRDTTLLCVVALPIFDQKLFFFSLIF